MSTHYTREDWNKFTYAIGVHRIDRILDFIEELGLDHEANYELKHSLDNTKHWLYLAAFTNDAADAEDAGRQSTDAMERRRAGASADAAPTPYTDPDLNYYSDGRLVTTTVRWDDDDDFSEITSGWARHIWHPDSLHPDNQPGQVFDLHEEHWPCARKLIVTASGAIDTFLDHGSPSE